MVSRGGRGGESRELTIGGLAAEAGVGLGTVRYYQKIGLLAIPEKSANGGIRRYSQADVDALNLIRNAQALGFPLKTIGIILGHRERKECVSVKSLILERQNLVRRQIEEQQAVLRKLVKLASSCQETSCPRDCKLLGLLADGKARGGGLGRSPRRPASTRMDQPIDERSDPDGERLAVAACSCPRRPDETLDKPKCAAAQLIGGSDRLLMLDPQRLFPGCPRFVYFGHSHFCACPARVRVYKTYRV